MPIKIFFIVAFLLIIFSLGSALFHLVKTIDLDALTKTVKALTFRIALSLVLFIMMYIAFVTGMIKPEGIGARMQMVKQHQLQTETSVKPQ